MKKITIITLLLIIAKICFANNEILNSADTTTKQLNEVSVTAMQTKIANNKLHVITVIDKKSIEGIPAETVSDLLENLPGVDVRSRGMNGVQADLSMRGGTFDQVVVMLNGINITDPQTGHYSLDLPIDVSMIDRIEILQGANMEIFGLSAFSGAINIITGSEEVNKTTASVTVGDNGYINPILGANYTIDNWTLVGSASYNQSSGYMHNTDYKYGNAYLQAVYRGEKIGTFDLQLGGQIKGFGANSFYSLAYPNQYEATKTLLGSLKYNVMIKSFGIEASVYTRTHQDRFELIRDYVDAPAWYTNHNHHLATTIGGNIKGALYSSIGKTSVGVEIRNERILSNVLGNPMEETRHVPGQADDVVFTHSKNHLNVNYFLEQSFFVKKFSASVGASGNYNTMFKNNFAFGANIGYQYVQGGNVFASVNRSLRLPTFTDLYYKSATQQSNPDLKAESSLTTEVGINYNNYGFSTHLNLYYRIGNNIIDWVKKPEDEKWISLNHSRVDAMGGEVSLGYHWNEWIPKAEVTYSFCHLNKESGEYLSKYALDYLKHKLTILLEHKIYKGFGASWQFSYQQRNGEYTNVEGAVEKYQPVCLLDGKIFWQGKKIRLFIEATNITNSKYYDYGGILQPGIWAKGGIIVRI